MLHDDGKEWYKRINSKEFLKNEIERKEYQIQNLENKLYILRLIRKYEHKHYIVKSPNTIPSIKIEKYIHKFFNKDIPFSFLDLSAYQTNHSSKIYFLLNRKREIVYVGKTIQPWPTRVEDHYDKDFCDARAIDLYDLSENTLLELEEYLINRLNPIYNKTHCDNINRRSL